MTTLADAELGRAVRVERMDLDEQDAAWLRAVGVGDGEELVVLRRAILGGPLHVRTTAGGEFAIGREVAARVTVTPSEGSTP